MAASTQKAEPVTAAKAPSSASSDKAKSPAGGSGGAGARTPDKAPQQKAQPATQPTPAPRGTPAPKATPEPRGMQQPAGTQPPGGTAAPLGSGGNGTPPRSTPAPPPAEGQPPPGTPAPAQPGSPAVPAGAALPRQNPPAPQSAAPAAAPPALGADGKPLPKAGPSLASIWKGATDQAGREAAPVGAFLDGKANIFEAMGGARRWIGAIAGGATQVLDGVSQGRARDTAVDTARDNAAIAADGGPLVGLRQALNTAGSWLDRADDAAPLWAGKVVAGTAGLVAQAPLYAASGESWGDLGRTVRDEVADRGNYVGGLLADPGHRSPLQQKVDGVIDGYKGHVADGFRNGYGPEATTNVTLDAVSAVAVPRGAPGALGKTGEAAAPARADGAVARIYDPRTPALPSSAPRALSPADGPGAAASRPVSPQTGPTAPTAATADLANARPFTPSVRPPGEEGIADPAAVKAALARDSDVAAGIDRTGPGAAAAPAAPPAPFTAVSTGRTFVPGSRAGTNTAPAAARSAAAQDEFFKHIAADLGEPVESVRGYNDHDPSRGVKAYESSRKAAAANSDPIVAKLNAPGSVPATAAGRIDQRLLGESAFPASKDVQANGRAIAQAPEGAYDTSLLGSRLAAAHSGATLESLASRLHAGTSLKAVRGELNRVANTPEERAAQLQQTIDRLKSGQMMPEGGEAQLRAHLNAVEGAYPPRAQGSRAVEQADATQVSSRGAPDPSSRPLVFDPMAGLSKETLDKLYEKGRPDDAAVDEIMGGEGVAPGVRDTLHKYLDDNVEDPTLRGELRDQATERAGAAGRAQADEAARARGAAGEDVARDPSGGFQARLGGGREEPGSIQGPGQRTIMDAAGRPILLNRDLLDTWEVGIQGDMPRSLANRKLIDGLMNDREGNPASLPPVRRAQFAAAHAREAADRAAAAGIGDAGAIHGDLSAKLASRIDPRIDPYGVPGLEEVARYRSAPGRGPSAAAPGIVQDGRPTMRAGSAKAAEAALAAGDQTLAEAGFPAGHPQRPDAPARPYELRRPVDDARAGGADDADADPFHGIKPDDGLAAPARNALAAASRVRQFLSDRSPGDALRYAGLRAGEWLTDRGLNPWDRGPQVRDGAPATDGGAVAPAEAATEPRTLPASRVTGGPSSAELAAASVARGRVDPVFRGPTTATRLDDGPLTQSLRNLGRSRAEFDDAVAARGNAGPPQANYRAQRDITTRALTDRFDALAAGRELTPELASEMAMHTRNAGVRLGDLDRDGFANDVLRTWWMQRGGSLRDLPQVGAGDSKVVSREASPAENARNSDEDPDLGVPVGEVLAGEARTRTGMQGTQVEEALAEGDRAFAEGPDVKKNVT